ncbi:MAG: DUF1499 domain-containing protein [Anaerolineae bacterium]|nr:DUF1499 domain-containing protein [Anaerolineae bacterium]
MLGLVVLLVIGFVVSRFWLIPAVSPRPSNLGVNNGQLTPCSPSLLNCVSSQSDSGSFQALAPIPYTGTLAEARAKLLRVITGMERSTIVDQSKPDYLHIEFQSLVWGFIDDTEFYFDDQAKVIHFRSAARLGRSDLNVNKQRIDQIKAAFANA